MTHIAWHWIDRMSGDDKEFFVALGQKVALLRKAQGMTQQQLAEQLGIAQQTLAHYEGAKLRIAASMLPTLAQIFGLSVDELIGQPVSSTPGKRGRSPKWQQQMEAIAQLPKARQRFVTEMLETVLAKG
ncbi:helix-turn-helix domain-containing protein [Xenophilus sp.]|uniref:helix-turn-helix domain-containing protein n=1 Tax=Xenophilus sp. TaxID=1873499 RepID=UPI0037DC422E